jgi:hypothetical protein
MISTSSSRQTLDCLTSILRCRYLIITGASRMLVMSVTPAPLHQRSPLDRTNSDHCQNYWCLLGDRLTINPLIRPGFVELDTTQNHLFGRLHHFPGSVITGDLEVNPQFVLVCSLHPQPSQTQQHPAHICKYSPLDHQFHCMAYIPPGGIAAILPNDAPSFLVDDHSEV